MIFTFLGGKQYHFVNLFRDKGLGLETARDGERTRTPWPFSDLSAGGEPVGAPRWQLSQVGGSYCPLQTAEAAGTSREERNRKHEHLIQD